MDYLIAKAMKVQMYKDVLGFEEKHCKLLPRLDFGFSCIGKLSGKGGK